MLGFSSPPPVPIHGDRPACHGRTFWLAFDVNAAIQGLGHFLSPEGGDRVAGMENGRSLGKRSRSDLPAQVLRTAGLRNLDMIV